MDFFPRLSFGCLTTRMQGHIFYNLLFWKIAFDLSPDFSLKAVICFLQELVLNTFAVGPKLFPYDGKICMFVAILALFHSVFLNTFVGGPKLFPYNGKTCMFVAILTLFHSVFCYRFLSWAQFWLFN